MCCISRQEGPVHCSRALCGTWITSPNFGGYWMASPVTSQTRVWKPPNDRSFRPRCSPHLMQLQDALLVVKPEENTPAMPFVAVLKSRGMIQAVANRRGEAARIIVEENLVARTRMATEASPAEKEARKLPFQTFFEDVPNEPHLLSNFLQGRPFAGPSTTPTGKVVREDATDRIFARASREDPSACRNMQCIVTRDSTPAWKSAAMQRGPRLCCQLLVPWTFLPLMFRMPQSRLSPS